MDLTPSEDQRELIEVLHHLAETQIRPAARECEGAGAVSEPIWQALFRMGLAVPVAEESGGQGSLDPLTTVLVAEELGWGDPGIAYGVLSSGAAARLIDQLGTPGQRAELLGPLAAGRQRAALAFAEAEGRTDLATLQSAARPDGPGTWRLSGTKYAVAGADSAGVLLWVTGGSVPTVWAIPAGAGVELEDEDKLGLRSAWTGRLSAHDVALSESDRLGAAGDHSDVAIRALMGVRLIHAGIALGLARAALEYATGYARQRRAFGQPIGAYQAISFMLADRAIELEAARLAVWEAAGALQAAGVPAGSLPAESGRAEELVGTASAQAVAIARAASDDAVQILGGHGYMRDHPVELWYRDAMTLSTLEGPGW